MVFGQFGANEPLCFPAVLKKSGSMTPNFHIQASGDSGDKKIIKGDGANKKDPNYISKLNI